MKVKATILLLLLGLTPSLTASSARAKDSAACRQRCDKSNLGLVCWDGANLLVCSTKGYIAIDKSKYQGPAGPAGAIGPQGRPGERGPQGLTGLQGPTGPQVHRAQMVRKDSRERRATPAPLGRQARAATRVPPVRRARGETSGL